MTATAILIARQDTDDFTLLTFRVLADHQWTGTYTVVATPYGTDTIVLPSGEIRDSMDFCDIASAGVLAAINLTILAHV